MKHPNDPTTRSSSLPLPLPTSQPGALPTEVTPQPFTVDQARAYIARMAESPSASAPAPKSMTVAQSHAYMAALRPWTTGKEHSFSRDLARKHGITAAILLKYLAFRITKSEKIHESRQWHYESIAALAVRYPYLTASAIHDTLGRLPETVLMRGRFNRRKNDKTTWYTIPDPVLMKQASEHLVYFHPEHAVAFGIHEAILIHNIRHWVKHNRRKTPAYRFHHLSPTTMAGILPLSRTSVARALKHLVTAGALEKSPRAGGQTPGYALRIDLDPCPIPGLTHPDPAGGAESQPRK